jgi:hypothetical protein
MKAPPQRFEMLAIALLGEQLPPGPAREDFEALTDGERMRIDLRNPRWQRIMAALGPDFQLTLPDDFADAVMPPPHHGKAGEH